MNSEIKWRIINSHWILFNLLHGYNGFSLIYAGLKSKTKKWTYLGIISEIPVIFFMVLDYIQVNPTSDVMILLKTLMVISIFFTLFVSLIIRKSFLNKLYKKDHEINDNSMTNAESDTTENKVRLLDI